MSCMRTFMLTFVVDFAVILEGLRSDNLYILRTTLHHELVIRIMGGGQWFFLEFILGGVGRFCYVSRSVSSSVGGGC